MIMNIKNGLAEKAEREKRKFNLQIRRQYIQLRRYIYVSIDAQCECVWVQFNSIASAISPISFTSIGCVCLSACVCWSVCVWMRCWRPAAWAVDFYLFRPEFFNLFSVRNCSTAYNSKVAAVLLLCAQHHIENRVSCSFVRHTSSHLPLLQPAHVECRMGWSVRTLRYYNININMYSCEVLQHNLSPFNLHIILNWRRWRRRRLHRQECECMFILWPRCAWSSKHKF